MCPETSPDDKKKGFGLPSTLTGPPVRHLVPPGQCQFGEDFTTVKLLERTQVSATSFVLRFGLPNDKEPLKLSTCACILAQAEMDGDSVVRPYTPISTNAQIGSFDLLVKNYGDHGRMSRYLCETLQVQGSLNFKHIPFNVKVQAEEFIDGAVDHILMLVGGTGITPMLQALHAVLGTSPEEDKDQQNDDKKEDDNKNNSKTKKAKLSTTKVTMLYGSRTSDDILGKELLDTWEESHPDQLKVVHVLSHEPGDSDWKGGVRGFINKELIEKHFPYNKSNVRVFVCGPPPMYAALCGPRDEPKNIQGVLGDLRFTADQVYKF